MIKKRQSGLTMISWMVVIAYLAIQGVMAMRIIPVYMKYNSLKSVMDSLTTDPGVKKLTAKRISKLFRKRLLINSLYELAKDKGAYKFKKIKNGYHLITKYEERGPIMGNLQFVANFEFEVDIITR